MKPLKRLESGIVVIPQADVDTDQIYPARYLTATTSEGFADYAFADWRFRSDGTMRQDAPLNQVDFDQHRILVAGHNFGCGSSREHAAWALRDLGIRAVLSTGLADIFRVNALKNGIAAIEIDPEVHARLASQAGATMVVDLESCTLTLPDRTEVAFEIDRFGRFCLLNGTDELGYLLSLEPKIDAFEQTNP